MDIGRTFSQSFAILKKNIAAMLVGGVLVMIASVVCSVVPTALFGDFRLETTGTDTFSRSSSLGAALLGIVLQVLVLTPLAAGLVAIAVSWAKTGRTAEIGEVFAGFKRLGALVLFQLILLGAYLLASILVMVIGFFGGIALAFIPFGFVVLIPLMLAPYVYIAINWLYVIAVLFDKDCGVMDALSESRRQIRRNGFWPTFVVAFLIGLAGFAATFVTLGFGSIVVIPWMSAAVVAMYFQASDRMEQVEAIIAGHPPAQVISQPVWPYGMGMGMGMGQGLPPGQPTLPVIGGTAAGMGGTIPGMPPAILAPVGPRSYDPRTAGGETPAGGATEGGVAGAAQAPTRPAPAQSWDQMPGEKRVQRPATPDAGSRPVGSDDAPTIADEPPVPAVQPPTPPTPPDPA
jgi:hypothetical protein